MAGSQPPHTKRLISLPRLFALAAGGTALGVLVHPPAWLPPADTPAAALVIAVVGLWASALVPEHLTALLFFLTAMLLKVAPADVIFSGFASSAWWLVLGGLVIGGAVKATGLGERLCRRLLHRTGQSYPGAILALTALSLIFGFLMPSALGRSVLLIPVAVAFADRLGFAQGSNGRIGLVTAVAFGAYTPTFAILPSNVPNMILFGSASRLYGVAPGYGEYLALHFPVLGLLKALCMIVLIVILFPAQPGRVQEVPTTRNPMTTAEKRLAVVLVLTLVFWASDTLHHISPGWVALAAGIFCLLPITGISSGKAFQEQINFGPLLFVAGALGIGAMVSHSGLGELLATALLRALPLHPDAPMWNVAALSAEAMLLGPLTTTPAVPAILTPTAAKAAATTGLPLMSVLMTQVLGFSTTLLPYQAVPVVVALGMAGEPVARITRFCIALAGITVLVLLPLDLLWWHWLGWL